MEPITNITKTATGFPVLIEDARNAAAQAVTVNITPTQAASADPPSPDNIRPIEGHTRVVIAHGTAKNMIWSIPEGTSSSKGIDFTFTGRNHISIAGTSTGANADSPNKYLDTASTRKGIFVPAGQPLTVSIQNTGLAETPFIRLMLRDIGTTNLATIDSTNLSWTFTPEEDTTIYRMLLRVVSTGSVIDIEGDFQIEYGDTATLYEAPDLQAYNVSLSSIGTVYGGTLDAVSGALTLNYGSIVLDGTENWQSAENTKVGFRAYLPGLTPVPLRAPESDSELCSHLRWTSAGSIGSKSNKNRFHVVAAGGLYLYFDGLDTVEDTKAYLAAQYAAGTPVTVIWETAPVSQQLSGRTIEMAFRKNIFWSTGTMSVTYESTQHADLSNILIYDRTAEDVERVRMLKRQIMTEGFASLTEAEQEEYMAGMRGAYNATDLNRVGYVVKYIADCMKAALTESSAYREERQVAEDPLLTLPFTTSDVSVSPKLNWAISNIPTVSQINTYLRNISRLRSLLTMPSGTPYAPATLDNMTYDTANTIERLLNIIFETFSEKELELYDLIDRTTLNRLYSDECFSGEF